MDINTAILIVKAVADGVEATIEMRDLAKRALNGEVITDQEILNARSELDDLFEEAEES